MKTLVTGGAGFIGSHLCDRLLAEGHVVTAVDDLSLGRMANIAHLMGRADFTFVQMDVSDQACLTGFCRDAGFDTVFHLAANSDIARSHADPGVDVSRTFATTISVLEAMRLCAIKDIVFASTSAVYGEAPGRIREDHGPLAPISHYGAAKLASEGFISSYVENYGLRSWIIRFPNVVGPRATHGAVFDFVGRLHARPDRLDVLGDGKQEKPYLFVTDLVDAMVLAWTHAGEARNVFNVGASSRTTVAAMARIVVEESGVPATIVFGRGDRGWIGDVPRFDYDSSRIRALGWAERLSSDEAVRATARALFCAVKEAQT